MKITKSSLLHLLGHAQASLNLSLKVQRQETVKSPPALERLEELTRHIELGGQIEIIDNCPADDQSQPVKTHED